MRNLVLLPEFQTGRLYKFVPKKKTQEYGTYDSNLCDTTSVPHDGVVLCLENPIKENLSGTNMIVRYLCHVLYKEEILNLRWIPSDPNHENKEWLHDTWGWEDITLHLHTTDH
jgi:hypothetical protein